MPRLFFTQQLARFVPVPDIDTAALGLRDALEGAFDAPRHLRGDVLDDQSHLSENVVIFVDGRRVVNRARLDDALQPASRVYILQALPGD